MNAPEPQIPQATRPPAAGPATGSSPHHSRGPGRGLAAAAAAAALMLGACAKAPPAAPAPRPTAAAEKRALPPIPVRTGPLSIDVVAPGEGEALPVRDSTFIYGSVGTGQARLAINGTPVPVEPNGTFLAWLPVPSGGVYHLVATTGADTARLERSVKVPGPPVALSPDSATILTGTITPDGSWTALPDEPVEVSFRGTPGGTAALILPDGRRVPLAPAVVYEGPNTGNENFGNPAGFSARPQPGVARYSGAFGARPLRGGKPGAQPALATVPDTARAATLELVVGTDTARAPLPLTLAVVAGGARVGLAEEAPSPDPHGLVVAQATTGGPYNWFFPDGTPLTLTGERRGYFRVHLAARRDVWVPTEDVKLLPIGTPPPSALVNTVRMTPTPKWIDVRLATGRRLPFQVKEGASTLSVTLYGATTNTNYMQYGALDPLLTLAQWSQPQDSVYTLTLHLSRPVWGYLAFFAQNGDLVVRLRRPPDIDSEHPLRGLRIVVDPGHPPGGATGPTRYRERDANLAVALKLRPLLEKAGAQVIMTRTDSSAVPLNARPTLAVRDSADLLLSIHNNGLPNGVNPFPNTGTSDYYFWPQSADLARSLDAALVAELGTRDLGVGRADLALVRPTWMPAVLTETMFLMVPRQEAALRDPGVQERIAEAHLRGLEAFLRGRAAGRGP